MLSPRSFLKQAANEKFDQSKSPYIDLRKQADLISQASIQKDEPKTIGGQFRKNRLTSSNGERLSVISR